MAPAHIYGSGILGASRCSLMRLPSLASFAVIVIALTFSGCEQRQKEARLKQIDAQLANWTPTGRPEDAQRRAALMAERVQLAADLGLPGPAPANNSSLLVTHPLPQYQPTPVAVIARDSNRADNRWQAMAPNSRWMDNSNSGPVYGRTIYNRSTSRRNP